MNWTDERLNHFEEKVDRRFDEVDRRFDEVDRRFQEVDRRFDKVEFELHRINDRLDGMARTLVHGFVGMTAAMMAGYAATIGLVVTQL